MRPLVQDVSHLDLLEVTREALKDCCFGWPPNPLKLEIHCDGSFNPDTGIATWAFIVLIIDDYGQMWFPRCMSGCVSSTPAFGDFLGANASPSDVAELHALAWSMMYVLQYQGQVFQAVEHHAFSATMRARVPARWRSSCKIRKPDASSLDLIPASARVVLCVSKNVTAAHGRRNRS